MGIVAKYKFDGSVYADLIPEFNAEFTNYTITDEVDSENSNHIIRTIESDSLPTLMRFGSNLDTYVEGSELALLEILDMNTSGLTSCYRMFRCCANLTNITCDWNTSNVTTMYAMFYRCYNLTTLDVSNFDTSNTTTMYCMFYGCKNLTMLDLNNFDTSNVTNMADMFTSTNNLKYLKCNNVSTLNALNTYLPTKSSASQGTIICKSDITNLDTTILQSKYWNVVTNPTLIAKYRYDSKIYKNTIPVFNEGYMGFVEDEEVDANGIVTRKIEHVELPTYMRFGETWETSQNQPTWRSSSLIELLQINDSNIANFSDMFKCCNNLRNVCKLNLNGIALVNTFFRCYNLEKLDLSNNTFSNVENINYIFSECAKLISLDISNFNLNKCRGFDNVFTNNISLKDIGMIYCDKSTINKVASLLPTDHNITIWVESDDILQYDQYDHITYKTQKVQDTVHLNSPLLMGDTIEVIDGKTYHVHRYWKHDFNTLSNSGFNVSVIDTSDYIRFYKSIDGLNFPLKPKNNGNIICDYLYADSYATLETRKNEGIAIKSDGVDLNINLHKSRGITSYQQFITWVQSQNPFIYELATPYYELISEEPLELTLLDTTDNTINNNSILPSNMTIANKELSTIAIKPSTTYTLSFDKSNVDSEVTIDICGGEQITTVLNRIELTTPSELGSGIRFISSDGCIISNVRLLEGSLVEKAIPKETFEGLKSSFEDGYIIGDFLGTANSMTLINTKNETQTSDDHINLSKIIKAKNPITLIFNTDIAHSNIRIGCYGDKGIGSGFYNNITSLDKTGFTKCLMIPTIDTITIRLVNYYSDSTKIGDMAKISNVVVLEGDHTHISEAELMRYIEKGTSHYEEEDFNHVGKYKVEYKVTGKNKINLPKREVPWDGAYLNSEGTIFTFIPNERNTMGVECFGYPSWSVPLKIKKGIPLTLSSSQISGGSWGSGTMAIGLMLFFEDGSTYQFRLADFTTTNYNRILSKTKTFDLDIVRATAYGIAWSISEATASEYKYYIQLEEGTVATEYEPYKEDIKTYYLSSPLLEGDTIEDINGVATHVKRYGKVVLDGSNYTNKLYATSEITRNNTLCFRFETLTALKYPILSNNFISYQENNVYRNDVEGVSIIGSNNSLAISVNKSRLSTQDVDGFKQWLSENPTVIVHQLASPIYEPISTESILLNSYTNGHLDLSNENIPIEKVKFINWYDNLKYLQSNTRYIVQFESDNAGKLDTLGVGGTYLYNQNVVKGLNEFILTTNNTPTTTLSVTGIGFNISNIQVVEANEDIEFGYFKGLQSSFEDGLVTDENDENYGKYKVECKIVGKNKCDGEYTFGHLVNNNYSPSETICHSNYIKVKPNSTYIISKDTVSLYRIERINLYDKNKNYINKIWGTSLPFNIPQNINYIRYTIVNTITEDNGDMIFNPIVIDDIPNFQIEEGTQATSYEPYKESIHTLYLNSPLLKGDKLVVHDGKLCHYHKMGMVVLDGSKDEYWSKAGIYIPFVVIRNVGLKPNGNMGHDSTKGKMCTNILQPNIITSTAETDNRKGIYVVGSGEYNEIRIRLTDNDTVNSVKQWLQQNPTTVVYELAEPYYEPIEPQLSSNSFSTIKDGDMEIITALPIEKINLTYRTDINGVSSIEEQIASIQEGTDISSIIDEEVDE